MTKAIVALLLATLKGVAVEAAVSSNNLIKFNPIGIGLCLDSQGNSYDYSAHYRIDTAESCATICFNLISTFGTGSVVGMEYSLPDQVCYCDFGNDKLTSQPDNANDWFSGYLGTGLPQQSDGNTGYAFTCYQQTPLKPSKPSKPSKPTPVKPTPTKPVPTRPTPIKPVPTRPTPIKPVPTRPAPIKPVPTRPAPIKPVAPTFLTSQFTYVGEGICADSQGNYYDFVKYDAVATVDACAVKCSDLIKAYPRGSFIGMEYSSTSQECLCNGENDKLSSAPVGASEWYGGNSGSGLPVKFDGGYGDIPYTCYAVSTVAPAQPSPTVAKPAPTAPTPVGLPPTTTPLTYVGEGICLGSQNRAYDWVQYYSVPSLSDCALKCANLATSSSKGSVVGMEYYSLFQDCYCDFENNRLLSQPSGSDEWNKNNTGTGVPLTSSTGTSGWSCYKFGKNISNIAHLQPICCHI
jgi:hypothetical protein